MHREQRTFISLDDAADRLAISVKTMRRMISRGDITGYRINRRLIRVDEADVYALLRVIPTVKNM